MIGGLCSHSHLIATHTHSSAIAGQRKSFLCKKIPSKSEHNNLLQLSACPRNESRKEEEKRNNFPQIILVESGDENVRCHVSVPLRLLRQFSF